VSNRSDRFLEENGEFQVKSCLSRGLLINERYLLEDLPHGPFLSEDEYFAALVPAFLGQANYLSLGHHCFFAPVPTPNEYKDEVDYKTAIGRWNDFVMLDSKIDNADNRLDYVIAGEVLTELFTEWKERSMISTGDYPPGHPG